MLHKLRMLLLVFNFQLENTVQIRRNLSLNALVDFKIAG